MTFDTYGSEEIGPSVQAFGLATPNLLFDRDQLDVVLVVAGPLETQREELLAGGAGYRFQFSETGPTAFANIDYARVTLGSKQSRAFNIKGNRTNLLFGLRQIWQLSKSASLTGSIQFGARHSSAEILGTSTLDEDLRLMRGTLLFQSGSLFGLSKRVGLSFTKGVSGFGSSGANNSFGSVRGSSAVFSTASFNAEVSVPLSASFFLNLGAIGQIADTSVPLSQKCGFGTNAYARGFDRSFVTGDSCLGGRGEIAYKVDLPGKKLMPFAFSQVFLNGDGGQIWNAGNIISGASTHGWASVSAGLRTLTKKVIAEVSASKKLITPPGTVAQKDTRLWFRAALKF